MNIDKYQDDITRISFGNKDIKEISNLSRFYKLDTLFCPYNQLITLPNLPNTLIRLECSNNQITVLPLLPDTLKILYCSHNQLKKLPLLPNNLKRLDCSYNQLEEISLIPNTLIDICCYKNNLILLPILSPTLEYINYMFNPIHDLIKSEDFQIINKKCNIIRHFKFYYNATKIRNFYYVKIKEPNIKVKAHPNNLIKMIEENPNMDIELIIKNFEDNIDSKYT